MLNFSQDDGVATLAFDRPEKKNAISLALWEGLSSAIAEIDRDPDIRVVILTGRGASFAAGADISEFETVYATRASAAAYMAKMAEAQSAIARCLKPTIAMIRGYCIGAGCGIALACDLRFADPGAQFAITPAKLGMIYSLADTRRLVDAVGQAAAHDLLLSGRQIDADEAKAMGLINRLVPAENLETATLDYARMLNLNSPAAIRGIKVVLRAIRVGAAEETDISRALFLDTLEHPDFAEGLTAFLGKRRPIF